MELDFTKFKRGNAISSYRVHYGIYLKEGKGREPSLKSLRTNDKYKADFGSGYCFSGLGSKFKSFVRNNGVLANRVIYKINYRWQKYSVDYLTDPEKIRWIELCKEHYLMPKSISTKDKSLIKDGIYRFNPYGMTLEHIYARLIAARCMQENTTLIRATIYLHDTKGVDFYLAYLASHYFCNANSGHSVFPVAQKYMIDSSEKYFDKTKISIVHAIRLKLFLSDNAGKKFYTHGNGKGIYEELDWKRSHGYTLHSVLEYYKPDTKLGNKLSAGILLKDLDTIKILEGKVVEA